MRRALAVLCAALLPAAAGWGAAAEAMKAGAADLAGADPLALSFEAFDTDGDGGISATEAAFEPDLWTQFGRFDANRDRRLSREEFARWKKQNLWRVVGPHLLLPPPRPPFP